MESATIKGLATRLCFWTRRVCIARMLIEPALAPIRKLVPAAGRIDFSPLILLVLLQILRRALMVK